MSAGSRPDRLAEVADELRAICEAADEADIGRLGRAACLAGVVVAIALCATTSVVAFAQLGIAPTGATVFTIGADVVCSVSVVWVVRAVRARAGRRDPRPAEEWGRTRFAGVLRLVVSLFLPADIRWIKWEEWCAELAWIDSPRERTRHLLGLLGRIHRVALAARERSRKGGVNVGSRTISSCSFCGADQFAVAKLIAGPGTYICDGCVGLARRALESGAAVGEQPARLELAEPDARCQFCGKGRRDTGGRLATSRGRVICGPCLDLCDEILGREQAPGS